MKASIPLLVIAGPTATGKSALAVALAERLGGEILSADSMQVYKYMDIGTAKVEGPLRARVPHHLLDLVEPNEDFSLAQYKEAADGVIGEIWERRRLPIMVGGTGLYIKAVLENYPLAQLPYDPACRARLNREWDQGGREQMVLRLAEADPQAALTARDRRRIIRALEVYELTGRSQSEIQEQAKEDSPYCPAVFALTLPRPLLYERIDARAESMVIQGLIGEYTGLIEGGYSPRAKAMQGLGYYHAGMHLTGCWTLPEMVANLQRDTRRYAKRQLSWFRGMAVTWIDNSCPEESLERVFFTVAGKLPAISE